MLQELFPGFKRKINQSYFINTVNYAFNDLGLKINFLSIKYEDYFPLNSPRTNPTYKEPYL